MRAERVDHRVEVSLRRLSPGASSEGFSGASSSISFVMRTPRSTDGSYSNVSCGVRFIRSSRATRPWTTPRADSSAAIASPAASLAAEHRDVDPRVVQVGRDGDAGDRDDADPRVLEPADRLGHDGAHRLVHAAHAFGHVSPLSPPGTRASTLGASEHPLLPGEPLLGPRRELLGLARLARDERRGQRAALPELVVVDLGHRRAEAVLRAAPSPTARTCACPSASRPPGSGARRRESRRSPDCVTGGAGAARTRPRAARRATSARPRGSRRSRRCRPRAGR